VSNKDFTVYPGRFPCKKCGVEVTSLRLWTASGDATWMCEQKHMSKVSLIPQKKKKSDYENE
jgi:hypothetical protein